MIFGIGTDIVDIDRINKIDSIFKKAAYIAAFFYVLEN